MALPEKYMILPEYWFFGVDSLFELAFFIVTALIFYHAYKVYKLTGKQGPKDLSRGFGLIALSYLIKSVTNFLIHFHIRGINLSTLWTESNLVAIAWSQYVSLIFMLCGLGFLSFIALKDPNRRTRSLIFVLIIASSFLTIHKIPHFYVVALALLGLLIYHYHALWRVRKDRPNLIMLTGFSSLFIAQALFFLVEEHILYYVTGHLLELVGYSLFLMNLLMVLWYGKKA